MAPATRTPYVDEPDTSGKSPYIHESINTIELWYQQGRVSYPTLVVYLRHWNSYYLVKRNTQAVWDGGCIRVFDPETSGSSYRHLKKEFGIAYQY